MYTVPQSRQLTIFLCAIGVGFLLGVLYDVIRAIRLSFTESKAAIVIFDVIYFFLLGILSFLFILAANKGEVRFYIILGQVIGWLFYYFSFGVAVIKVTDAFSRSIKRLRTLIYRVISAPFRLIFRCFQSLFGKICKVFKKTEKKSQKIRKKHLPKLRLYVYNLFGIISVGRNSQKKGGQGFGKNKKEKKTNSSR